MPRFKLSLLPTASLIAISTLSMFGLSASHAALAQTRTLQQRPVVEYQRPTQTTPRSTTIPVPIQVPGHASELPIQVPGNTSEVQCGPKTCTCVGIDDCNALFTGTHCVPGTEVTTEDDHGECTKQ